MTAPRHLGRLFETEHALSYAKLAGLLRRAAGLRSRDAIAEWCGMIADELDLLCTAEGHDEISMRALLRRNLKLSRPAANLLLKLAAVPEQLHKRKELSEAVGTTPGALKVYVCEIRTGFNARGVRDSLRTVWGEGYILNADGAAFVAHASRKLLAPLGFEQDSRLGQGAKNLPIDRRASTRE